MARNRTPEYIPAQCTKFGILHRPFCSLFVARLAQPTGESAIGQPAENVQEEKISNA